MIELITLLFGAALVNNFVLVNFLGLCPFVGTSRRMETALPMSFATCFVILVATVVTHSINIWILEPFDLGYLKIVTFIAVIAAVVQATEKYVRHVSPLLHQLLGIYLPLITSNCAVLGVVLIVAELSIFEAIFVSVGAALGFSLVLVLFAGLRTRLQHEAIPKPFRGSPIALVTIGLMALAFTGFKGFV